jgi:hypothetical protein
MNRPTVKEINEGVSKLVLNPMMYGNYMDCRNKVHRKYLEVCGFAFTGNYTYHDGQPFEYFEKWRNA